MLQVQNIKKSFGGVRALDGCSFKIAPGKVTALIGPNGAGKTTVFNAILGTISIDSGDIFFGDRSIKNTASYVRAQNGLVRTFQHVRLFKHLSILDHLVMVESTDDTKFIKSFFDFQTFDRSEYEMIVKDYGIDRPIDTLVSELSFGQQKLLQIAMALRMPHTMLFFDEPVAGVNSIVQAKIEKLLDVLKRSHETMVLIDHDMEFVRNLADEIIVMDAGKVLASGAPDDVLAREDVLAAYLGT